MDFPKTLAAVKKAEGSQWAIGDALIIECGPPGDSGKKDGSYARLKACSEYLVEQGFDYNIKTLVDLRQISWNFKGLTVKPLPFALAHAARTPEMYSAVVTAYPLVRPTVRFIREKVQEIQQAAINKKQAELAKAQKDKEQAEQAVKIAETKVALALDDESKTKAQAAVVVAEEKVAEAEKREVEYKTPPRALTSCTPETEVVPTLALGQQLRVNASKARQLAEESRKILDEYGADGFSEAMMDSFLQRAEVAVTAWNEIVALYGKKKKSTAVLSIIHGGASK